MHQNYKKKYRHRKVAAAANMAAQRNYRPSPDVAKNPPMRAVSVLTHKEMFFDIGSFAAVHHPLSRPMNKGVYPLT